MHSSVRAFSSAMSYTNMSCAWRVSCEVGNIARIWLSVAGHSLHTTACGTLYRNLNPVCHPSRGARCGLPYCRVGIRQNDVVTVPAAGNACDALPAEMHQRLSSPPRFNEKTISGLSTVGLSTVQINLIGQGMHFSSFASPLPPSQCHPPRCATPDLSSATNPPPCPSPATLAVWRTARCPI
jgi:hypothetical protein